MNRVADSERDRPNVVIIYADDLGYGDLGCYGSPTVRTPHLDELADRGVRCTNWYANSPVCSPSRAALLTGRHPGNAGVQTILGGRRGEPGLPESQLTLAEVLAGHGYRSGIFGKWHLGTADAYRPSAHGFDRHVGFLAGCVDYFSHIFYWGMSQGVDPVHDLWEDDQEIWRNGEYLTDIITDQATSFIREQAARDTPFFCYVPYNTPHYPLHAPAQYLDRFADLPADTRIMAAMIAAMDDGVGAIIDTLRDAGQLENTLVFFSSDNGPSIESRNWLDGTQDHYYGGSTGGFRGYKGSLFDGGIREPAIVSMPGVLPQGATCSGLGQMIDVVPTVLGILGIHTESAVDGMDVRHMWSGGPSPHTQAFWSCGEQLAVREGRWKLVLNGRPDLESAPDVAVHLAELDSDPGESINRADDEPERTARLEADARGWYAGLEQSRGQ